MRVARLVFSVPVLVGLVLAAPGNAAVERPSSLLPSGFEAHDGQMAAGVRFSARGRGYALLVGNTKATLWLDREPGAAPAPVALKLVGARPATEPEGLDALPGRVNRLHGRDPRRWRRGVRTYARVRTRDAYPGIDVVWYRGAEQALEFDLVVQPGADPSVITLGYRGVERLEVDAAGDLLLHVAGHVLRQRRPLCWQDVDGTRQAVTAHYVARGPHAIGIAVAAWDRSRPLVIDPVLLHSTYLGGVHDDAGSGIVSDAAGNVYVVGSTASEDFPVTGNAFQRTRKNIGSYRYDAFVTKLDPSGVPVFTTFFGGNENDFGYSIAVDPAGDVLIGGQTGSSDLATTSGTPQPELAGYWDAFVARLSADGAHLRWATYLGGTGSGWGNSGNDFVSGIALDADGDVYLTGGTGSADFPTTPGAYLRTFPSASLTTWVAKLAGNGAALRYSTLLGSSGFSRPAAAIAVDQAGRAIVAGKATQGDFPVTTDAQQPVKNGGDDAFVTVLAADGSALVYSSYLGGTGNDWAWDLARDADGFLYLGIDSGSADFPVTPGAFASPYDGGSRAFVVKLAPDGSPPVWSAGVGPILSASGLIGDPYASLALAVDEAGRATIAGHTSATAFPVTTDAVQPDLAGDWDGFVTTFTANGDGLVHSSFFGGAGRDGVNAVATDVHGNVLLTGATQSTDFPTTAGAVQPSFGMGDGYDAFVTTIGSGTVSSVSPASGGNAGSVTLTIRGSGFQAGAAVTLERPGASLAASRVVASAAATALTAVVELGGAAPGTYDVVVANPNGRTVGYSQAFTVTSGGAPSLWTNVTGRSAIRVGVPSRVIVTYGNAGDVDAYGVTVRIRSSPGVELTPGFEYLTPPEPGALPDGEVPRAVVLDDGSTLQSLLVPLLPAGSSVALPFSVVAAAPGAFTIDVFASPPWTTSLAELEARAAGALAPAGARASTMTIAEDSTGDAVAACMVKVTEKVQKEVEIEIPEPCLKLNATPILSIWKLGVGGVTSGIDGLNRLAAGEQNVTLQPGYNENDFLNDYMKNLGECAEARFDGAVGKLIKIVTEEVTKLVPSDNCPPPPPPGPTGRGSHSGEAKNGIDPNDKTGPSGIGPQRWVTTRDAITYFVAFENLPSATAPAAEVVVIDQLDASRLDLATLSLGPIGFGDTLVALPPGRRAFNTTVDLRPAQDLLVRIAAGLDDGGVLTWRFESIDPATGLPPEDPTVGFLPPNTNPPAGDGGVFFTVRLKPDLAEGVAVQNQARIVFDRNAPIDTPSWTNTVAACGALGECFAVLLERLPPRDGPDRRQQKISKRLRALAEKARRMADVASSAAPERRKPIPMTKLARSRERAYGKTRKALAKLLAVAEAADRNGTLGVSLASLEGPADVLLVLIDDARRRLDAARRQPGKGAASGLGRSDTGSTVPLRSR